MNKFISILSFTALSLSFSSLYAQSGRQVAGIYQATNKPHKWGSDYSARFHAMLEKQQQARITAKHSAERATSSTAERLIALSDYDYNPADSTVYYLGLIDSSSFKYSGQRGSTFNNDILNFVSPSGQFFLAGGLMNIFYGVSVHKSTSNIYASDILSDTALFWNSDITDSTGRGVYMYAEKVNDLYDAYNDVTFCSDQNYPIDSSGQWDQYINTYDANNNIISSLDMSWDAFSFSFDTGSLSFYFYNSSNQLIADSMIDWVSPGSWNPFLKDSYSYTSGNLTNSIGWLDSSGVWVEEAFFVITYNADNTINLDSFSQNNGMGVFVPNTSEAFGYTPGSDFWTSLQITAYSSGSIFETDQYSKSVNASGLADTIAIRQFDASSLLFNGEKAVYLYDGYSNPTVYYGYIMNAGSTTYPSSPDAIGHFYYEPYQSTAAVKNIAATTENISIYPNPAIDAITVSRPGAVIGSLTNMVLTSITGQKVRTVSMPWMSETASFPLDGLAPGTYIFTLQGQSGNVIYTQKVVKL